MKRIVCSSLVFFFGLSFVADNQAQTRVKQKKEKFQVIQMADNKTQGANVYENLKGNKVFDGWKCFDSSDDAENNFNKSISDSVIILETNILGKTDKNNYVKKVFLTDINEVKKRSFRIMRLQDKCVYIIAASTSKLVLEFENWQQTQK